MELSNKDLKKYNITKEQYKDLLKCGIDIEFFINTLEKDIIYKRNKKINKLKNK